MAVNPGAPLLDPAFQRQLARLALVNRHRLRSSGKGERRSVRRGASIEFMDYRQYSPGDDLRQVDWNAYGRLGALHLKLFEEEELLTAHVLLDVSRSMEWGQPRKFDYARRLAAALSHVALGSYDRLELAAIGDHIVAHLGPSQGPASLAEAARFLGRLQADGQTGLSRSIRAYALQHRQPGLAIIISDLLSPEGCEAGLHELVRRRFEVALLHVLAPQEIEPPIGGDLRLIDRETGHAVEVSLNPRALEQYHRRFLDWTTGIAAYCRRHGVLYHQVSTARPLIDLLFRDLRERGLLR